MRAEGQQIHVSRAQRTLPSQATTCRRLALPSEIISQSYVPKVDTAIIRTSIRKLHARILGEVRSRAKRPHLPLQPWGSLLGCPDVRDSLTRAPRRDGGRLGRGEATAPRWAVERGSGRASLESRLQCRDASWAGDNVPGWMGRGQS